MRKYVTFAVPVVAVLLAENVRLELPLPGAAMEVGAKAAVTPVGSPEADKDTAELNPPLSVVETVELPEVPWTTESATGEAVSVKSGAATEFTVRPITVV